MPIRVLIAQPSLPDYRVDLFNGLADADDLDVTVLHPGRTFSHHRSVRFREVVTRETSIGGLHYDRDLGSHARDQDLLVLPFDLRWLSNAGPLISKPDRVLLWGHGLGRNTCAIPIRTALARRAAGTLLYERAEMWTFMASGISPERLHVAGNTIAVPNHGVGEGPRTQFIFVGRLNAHKRVDLLLEAFALVQDQLPNSIGISIIGSGPCEQDLRDRTIELGLESLVTIEGPVHDPDLLRLQFARALGYVSPGPVGLGALHSFAYGVPVITDALAEHGPERHSLNIHNSLCYEGGVDALGWALLRLAHDPGESRRLGNAGYELYRSYYLMEHMVERYGSAIRRTHALRG